MSSDQGEDAQLPVGGGGSDDKLADPGFGADVLERCIAHPDIAILGGEEEGGRVPQWG